jgi:glycosyltransferase involved in cell wall biosynthesis
MHILHCITCLSGDGAQHMLLRLVNSLQRIGCYSTIVTLKGRQDLNRACSDIGVPVFSLSMTSVRGALSGVAALRRLIETIKPDVLQGWMYHANVVLSLACRGQREESALVWNVRRGLDDLHSLKFSTQLFVKASARLSARPRRIIYCTDRSRLQHEAIGYRSNSSVVIDNGFDSSRFRDNPDARSALRRTLGIAENTFVIGCVGRYNQAKGHTFLFAAFQKVLERNPAVCLVLAGRGSEWSNSELVELARSYGIASHVILLGQRPHIEEVYPMFDVLCSSSVAEGFPNVVAEAMLCQVPCVVTDTGASRMLVEGLGLVVPPRSSDDLADALLQVSHLSSFERLQIGRKGRERITDGYSLDRITTAYRTLYEQMATQGTIAVAGGL